MTDQPKPNPPQDTPEARAARSWGSERERLLAAMARTGAKRVRREKADGGRNG